MSRYEKAIIHALYRGNIGIAEVIGDAFLNIKLGGSNEVDLPFWP